MQTRYVIIKNKRMLKKLLNYVSIPDMPVWIMKLMVHQFTIRVLSQLYSQYPGCQGLVLPFL